MSIAIQCFIVAFRRKNVKTEACANAIIPITLLVAEKRELSKNSRDKEGFELSNLLEYLYRLGYLADLKSIVLVILSYPCSLVTHSQGISTTINSNR